MGNSNSVIGSPYQQLNQGSYKDDDFYSYSSGGMYTTLANNSGTVAADATNGTDNVKFTTGGTTGNYAGIQSSNTNWLFQAGQSIWIETYLNWTSVGSNTAAIVFGLASASPVNSTPTAVPTASYSGALLIKPSSSVVWSCQSSNGTTKTNNTSIQSGVDGFYKLRIDVNNFNATQAEVLFSVNDRQLQDSNTQLRIVQTVNYTSLAAMYLFCYVQPGTNSAQTAYCDYVDNGKYRGLGNNLFS